MAKDPNRAPTIKELEQADQYAARRLCTEIPTKNFTGGLTKWDEKRKRCGITQVGCESTALGPLSIDTFTINGTLLNWEDLNVSPKLKKFWSLHPPNHLVWKKVKGKTELGCARSNFKLQQFCEFPAQRNSKNEAAFDGNIGKGNDNVPPFRYVVRNGVETCVIGRDYCDAKQISYNEQDEECYISLGQQIAEFLIGTTLIREMKAAGFGPFMAVAGGVTGVLIDQLG
jgi:hypothetical protein